MGFSRQEYWSRLPFPSPVHESEKRKWSHSVVSDSSRPCGLQPTRLLHPWDFLGKSTGVGCHCLLLSNSNKSNWSSWMHFISYFFCNENSIEISAEHLETFALIWQNLLLEFNNNIILVSNNNNCLFPNNVASKESACNSGDTGDAVSIAESRRFPGREKWHPTPVFLPEKSHGQRSLVV